MAYEAAKQANQRDPYSYDYAADPVWGHIWSPAWHDQGQMLQDCRRLLSPEIIGKYLELLKEAVPKLSNVAVLFHEDTRPTFLTAQAKRQDDLLQRLLE